MSERLPNSKKKARGVTAGLPPNDSFYLLLSSRTGLQNVSVNVLSGKCGHADAKPASLERTLTKRRDVSAFFSVKSVAEWRSARAGRISSLSEKIPLPFKGRQFLTLSWMH